MLLQSHELNRRAQLERKNAVDDGHGGKTLAWPVIARPWVKATPIGGKESLAAGTLQASQGWRIVMRRRDITTADRLVAPNWPGTPRNQLLNIRSVADVEGDRDAIVLLCDTQITP